MIADIESVGMVGWGHARPDDCARAFADEFKANGGEVLDTLPRPMTIKEPNSKVHRRTYSDAVKKSPERDAAKAQEYFEHPRTSLAADVQRRAHREEYHGELRLGSWRRLREEQTHHYVRWSFFAVIAAVIVGLIGVGLTFLH